jgi:hypothetical protein
VETTRALGAPQRQVLGVGLEFEAEIIEELCTSHTSECAFTSLSEVKGL